MTKIAKHSLFEKTPNDCLEDVLMFLSISEIATTMRVCKMLYKIMNTRRFYLRLTDRENAYENVVVLFFIPTSKLFLGPERIILLPIFTGTSNCDNCYCLDYIDNMRICEMNTARDYDTMQCRRIYCKHCIQSHLQQFEIVCVTDRKIPSRKIWACDECMVENIPGAPGAPRPPE